MADIISVFDYPKEQYSAYWEIGIDAESFSWEAKIIDYASGHVLASETDESASMEDARFASQSWALERMPVYRRKEA